MGTNTDPLRLEDLPLHAAGVLARVRIYRQGMSDAERKVANAFLADAPVLINQSVEAMAESIGVSSATIVRFTQRVGYRGIRDFKLALASEVFATNMHEVHKAVDPDDSVIEIAQKILKSDEQAIVDSRQVLDEVVMEQAVEALVGASSIVFLGVGSSMPIAMDAYYRFSRIGMPVSFVSDPYMQLVECAMLKAGTVAFAISHTGLTLDTYRSFKAAKDCGATCILLTSNQGGPMGEIADIEIVTATHETAFRTQEMSSRIAHLSLIDALYVAVAIRKEHSAELMHRLDQIFRDTRM